MDAIADGGVLDMGLPGPAAVQRQKGVVAFRQVHYHAHQLLDDHFSGFSVVQFCVAGNHIAVVKHGVIQQQPQAFVFFIPEPHGQGLAAALCKGQTTVIFIASLGNSVALINKIRGKTAVWQDALHGRVAVIALADAGILQKLAVQIVAGGIIYCTSQRNIMFQPQGIHIRPGQAAAVINVDGVTVARYGKDVAGILRIQLKNLFLLFNHSFLPPPA